MSGHQTFKKVTFWWPDRATKISRWWCDENNIIRSRILPPFTSDRKSKHPTFILASYGAEYYHHFRRKSKHPTFIFSVIRTRILAPFISDRKSSHPSYFSVIRSRILPPFISDRKSSHPTFILVSYGAECYRNSFPTVKANAQHLF